MMWKTLLQLMVDADYFLALRELCAHLEGKHLKNEEARTGESDKVNYSFKPQCRYDELTDPGLYNSRI